MEGDFRAQWGSIPHNTEQMAVVMAAYGIWHPWLPLVGLSGRQRLAGKGGKDTSDTVARRLTLKSCSLFPFTLNKFPLINSSSCFDARFWRCLSLLQCQGLYWSLVLGRVACSLHWRWSLCLLTMFPKRKCLSFPRRHKHFIIFSKNANVIKVKDRLGNFYKLKNTPDMIAKYHMWS